jgi:hypothetical protein
MTASSRAWISLKLELVGYAFMVRIPISLIPLEDGGPPQDARHHLLKAYNAGQVALKGIIPQ